MNLKLFFPLLTALFITSCSSDEPVTSVNFDKSYARSLSDGETDVTYRSSDYKRFDKSEFTKDKWVDITDELYVGWGSCTPSTIIIQDGNVYTDYEMYNPSTGPSVIGTIWNAYLYTTGKKYSLHLYQDFSINDPDNTVSIGHANYTVLGITPKSFQLEYISRYEGGKGGLGGFIKEVNTYSVDENGGLSKDALVYDSEKSLVKDVIARCRETFGDVVDLNKVYEGMVIYDNPELAIFNLDDVARHYGIE